MIIFINGSFAVGKTTIAELLVQRIPHSMLFDPEEIGSSLARIVRPVEQLNDFQDISIWRPLVVTTAHHLREAYQRTLIMPMTIWHRPYFDEIINGLRQFEPQVHHFCLTASEKTLFHRLSKREHTPQAYAWITERIPHCVNAFQSPAFAVQIATEGKTPGEIVEEILLLVHCGNP